MGKERISNMTYPDGTIHQVIFHTLYPITISGVHCVIARYNDLTLGQVPMTTLISCINGVWCKTPLNKEGYDYLDYYILEQGEGYDANEYDLSNVYLSQAMNLALYYYNNDGDERDVIPVFEINFYVSLNPNGETWIPETIFRSAGLVIKDDIIDYEFYKVSCSGSIIKKIIEGTKKFFINNHGVKEYDFYISNSEGAFVERKVKSPDGLLRAVMVYSIPGDFKCRAFYSNFIYKEDYKNSEECYTIDIKANEKDYDRQDDIDRVWKDAGLGKLPIIFDGEKNKGLYR